MDKMFYGSAPVLYVSDILKSVDYYCDVLGFERPYLWDDPPAFAMPKREGMIVMLSRQDDHSQIRPKESIWDVYYWVRDAYLLFEEFEKKGAKVRHKPTHRPDYGNIEFMIEDPDGYVLAFGQETSESAFFDFTPTTEMGDTKLLYMSPVFASSDVARDIEWYESKMGFKNVFDSTAYQKGPVDYAVLGRQDLYIHLQYQFEKDMTSTDLRFQVKNIAPLFQEYLKKQIVQDESMRNATAWGTNEFGLFDPSGNRITFFEDI